MYDEGPSVKTDQPEIYVLLSECHKELEHLSSRLSPVLTPPLPANAEKSIATSELIERARTVLAHIRELSARVKI